MLTPGSRGSVLLTALTVLMAIFIVGSGLLSLGMQADRRGALDLLRARALALAEAGAEKGVYYVRTYAPDGTTDGTWRTRGWQEYVGEDYFTLVVEDGQGDNAGKLVLTSTGVATHGSVTVRRAVRVVGQMSREDVSIWNNAIFADVGQTGRSIQGNVRIRGGVHLLGNGESFTDLDGDGRWDSGEPFTDRPPRNGVYDIGEPYTDTDGDGHYDRQEPFDDINGNGVREPPLTTSDLAGDFGGTAHIGNNYTGMSATLRALLPPPDMVPYGGEIVESLRAKLRVKHGRVNLSGTANAGDPNVSGGSPPVKEELDGTYVTDGFGGTAGASNVNADNGAAKSYDLADIVRFPTLTESTVKGGVSYATYMDYLRATGMVISSPLTLKVGTAYGPVTDGRGNYLSVDTLGNITVQGIIYVQGDINIQRNGGNRNMRYSGRGTLVSTGSIYVSTDLLPTSPTFPVVHALGLIARRKLELATGSGDAQIKMAGAFYAQEKVKSVKQNEIAGTFVSSFYDMQNVPDIFQVPLLASNLPPGMPGAGQIWVKTIRLDSWREIAPG